MYSEQLKKEIKMLGFQVEREIPVNRITTNYIVNKISEESPSVLKMVTIYSEEEKKQLKCRFENYKNITEKYPDYMIQFFESYWLSGESDYEEKFLVRTQYCLSLKELQRKRNLVLEDVINIGIHIGTALSYLYKEGMDYNGLTEDSIYFDEKNNCYKLDNRLIELNTDEIAHYMSPEWFSLHKYNQQNDIYSIGILLYQLLNEGYFPFEDKYETDKEVQKARMEEKIPDLKYGTYNLNQVIQKACDKNENRFQSMDEFIYSLQYIYDNLKEEWKSSLLICYYKDEKSNDWDKRNNRNEKVADEKKFYNPIVTKKKKKWIRKHPKKSKKSISKKKKPEVKSKKKQSYKQVIGFILIIIFSIIIVIFAGIFLFQSKNHRIQSYIDSKSYSAAAELIKKEYESGRNVNTVTKNFIDLCMDQTEENKIIEVIECFDFDYYENNKKFFDSLIEELNKRGKVKVLNEVGIQLKKKQVVPEYLVNKIEEIIEKEEE